MGWGANVPADVNLGLPFDEVCRILDELGFSRGMQMGDDDVTFMKESISIRIVKGNDGKAFTTKDNEATWKSLL